MENKCNRGRTNPGINEAVQNDEETFEFNVRYKLLNKLYVFSRGKTKLRNQQSHNQGRDRKSVIYRVYALEYKAAVTPVGRGQDLKDESLLYFSFEAEIREWNSKKIGGAETRRKARRCVSKPEDTDQKD